MIGRWLAGALVMVAWTQAAAAPYDEAVALFDRGNYLEAASLAATTKSAPGLALAARARLAHAIYMAEPEQRPAHVDRAANDAMSALALDPQNVEARLQLVIALYQQSRATSAMDAYFKGYAEDARSHLDVALKLEPDNPWAYSLLGGWHFEIVRLAGPAFASFLFDANLAEGRAAFARSIALMPGNIVVQYEYARALLLSDAEANRAEAVRALETALSRKPKSHLEMLMAARARATLDAVNTGSPETLQAILDPDR